MGILKDVIRKVLVESAQEKGVNIEFIDSPTRLIESAAQAKQHDMELVEGRPKRRKYEREVYTHNPSAPTKESDNTTLYLYVVDESTNKAVAYLSFLKNNVLEIVEGCGYGEYNVWRNPPCSKVSTALTLSNIERAKATLERKYPTNRHQFIITRKGAKQTLNLPKGL